MEKKHISEIHENHSAQLLIQAHTVGSLRDASDFITAKYHVRNTIAFTKQLLEDVDGTIEEKLEHLTKVLEDLEKFKVK